MRKGFRNAQVAVLVIIGFVGVGWLALRGPADPVYKGKRLTEWLRGYDKPTRIMLEDGTWGWESDPAIRSIGTNAIPMLLRLLQARDSTLTLKLIKLAQRQHWIKVNHVPVWNRNFEAAEAFRVLGASASNAVPDLILICRPDNSLESQYAILLSLARIGPSAKSAVPLLVRVLTDTNEAVRGFALGALSEIHAEPEMVVPALVSYLHDPNLTSRLFAAIGLGNYGAEAKLGTSGLLELAHDPDPHVCETALHALSQIYARPEWDAYTKPHLGYLNMALSRAGISSLFNGVIKDLGAMGTNATPAVPALVKLLADPSEQVRSNATNALKAIDPKFAAKVGVE